MFCPNCGTENPTGAFCKECGTPLNTPVETTQVPTPQSVQIPVSQPVVPNFTQPYPPAAPAPVLGRSLETIIWVVLVPRSMPTDKISSISETPLAAPALP